MTKQNPPPPKKNKTHTHKKKQWDQQQQWNINNRVTALEWTAACATKWAWIILLAKYSSKILLLLKKLIYISDYSNCIELKWKGWARWIWVYELYVPVMRIIIED